MHHRSSFTNNTLLLNINLVICTKPCTTELKTQKGIILWSNTVLVVSARRWCSLTWSGVLGLFQGQCQVLEQGLSPHGRRPTEGRSNGTATALVTEMATYLCVILLTVFCGTFKGSVSFLCPQRVVRREGEVFWRRQTINLVLLQWRQLLWNFLVVTAVDGSAMQ